MTSTEQLQAEVEHWRDRDAYHQIRLLKFIDAARQLMECERQRQAQQDEHKEKYNEEVWIPPRRGLYQRSVDSIDNILHGLDWEKHKEECCQV